jgi:hypothetical protein
MRAWRPRFVKPLSAGRHPGVDNNGDVYECNYALIYHLLIFLKNYIAISILYLQLENLNNITARFPQQLTRGT